ncbi:polycomb group RING finger protein 1-like [Haliotis rubra]|uniref:polycomb group RING finger protein 1-like n=1 Tax=Haliotis rubra TaxID=36100 RepID=UPI001EE51AC3|nr:polycomb group RING finger protein 1-like [Haliotis rubra]
MMDDSMMHIRIRDVNPNIVCSLCAGYFIDATTITECLHTFCKSCIVKYLQTSKCCPQCNVKVHETQPLFHLRADRTLQDIVYKLVPGLFESEEKRREEFNKARGTIMVKKDGKEKKIEENQLAPRLSSILNNPQSYMYRYDEQICLCLERFGHQTVSHHGKNVQLQPLEKKFVRCSIRVLISHLKSMLYKKLGIPSALKLEVLCGEEEMADEMSMKQIYLMYWCREVPMTLFYRIQEPWMIT